MTNENESDSPTSNVHAQSPPSVLPPIPLQRALPDDGKGQNEEENNETEKLSTEFRIAEKWIIGTNIVLTIIGLFALFIYHGQLDVMRGQLGEIIKQYPELQKSADAAKESADVTEKSFNLTTRRAEDSDEAVCAVRGETENGGNVEHISINNSGKVTAHAFTAHIEVSRYSLPSNKILTLFKAFDVSRDEVRAGTPIIKDFVLDGFGPKDWVGLADLREAVVVSGRMQYENGFGSIRHSTFCQAFIRQPANPGDSPQTPLNVLVDCDTLVAVLSPLYERLKNNHSPNPPQLTKQ